MTLVLSFKNCYRDFDFNFQLKLYSNRVLNFVNLNT